MPQLRQLKLWLMAGATGGRWSLREAMCCVTMHTCTTITRKITRKALRLSYHGNFSSNKAGTWLMP
jgi:hypothetical protein